MISHERILKPSLPARDVPSPAVELVVRLIAVSAFVASIGWGFWLTSAPLSLVSILAAGWCVVRVLLFPEHPELSAAISCVMFAGSFVVTRLELNHLPNWLRNGIFSAWGLMGMVAVLFAIDACSLAKKYSYATKGRVTTSRMLLSAVAAAVSIYMIFLPTVDWIISSNTPPSSGVLEEMSSSEWVRLKTMEVFFAVWFFAVGASIGSFLNVVAYRLPRRESLVFRSSKCPHCGVQIQSRDNVPLLGWLKLGGRCRNCAAPISMRYPIVEAVTGGAFLVLYFVELISGGSNLPVRQPNAYAGVVWILMYTKWDLVGLYLFHCAVLCTLLNWGLIRVDDHRVPLGSIFSATAVVMGTICCFPGLVIVPWRAEVPPLLQEIPYAQVLCTAGIGWLAGLLSGAAVLAVVAWRKETSARLPSLEFAAGFGLVGLAWGWQSVFLIAIFTAMLQQVLRTEELRKIFQVPCPPEISLPIVAYLHLLGWRVVSELPAQAWQYFSAL